MNKKATGIIILLLTLIVAELTAICIHRNMDSIKLKRQLDLGNKYLLEENYEQAIAEFKVAIEIDPLCLDAYLGIADAYIELEEYDEVYIILNEGIEAFESSGNKGAVKQLNKKITSVDERKADEVEKETVTDIQENDEISQDVDTTVEPEEEQIQEEMLYPQVKIKPVLDIADTIMEGRSWLDIKRSEAHEDDFDNGIRYYNQHTQGLVEFWNGGRTFREFHLEDTDFRYYSDDELKRYFRGEKIVTREALLSYWGFDEKTKSEILSKGTSSTEYVIDVYTEYGKAKLSAFRGVYDEGGIPDIIKIYDIEKYPKLTIYYEYADSGIVILSLTMEE